MSKDLDTEQRSMSQDATARLFIWAKTTDLEIPPQVLFDLGVVIGRLRSLEQDTQ